MANTFTSWANPAALGPVLDVLRQAAVLPRLVRTELGLTPATRGSTVDISKTATATARDITSATVPAANQDITGAKVTLTLNKWQEATYHVDDQEANQIRDGVVSMQMGECIKAIGNAINNDILREMFAFAHNSIGTPGSTPFSGTSVTLAATAKRILSQQLAPVTDRRIVIDPLAEAAALTVGNILQAEQKGDQLAIVEGQIGKILGFNWFMDQNVTTNTATTTSWATGWSSDGSAAVGVTSLAIVNATSHGAINAGFLFTIAGSAQIFAVTATTTAVTAVTLTIAFSPAVLTAIATAGALTVVAAYTPNLAFHRDAACFVSRPLAGAFNRDDSMTIQDPVTGIALRLMITREHYQETCRVSALWGSRMLRGEHVVRMLG